MNFKLVLNVPGREKYLFVHPIACMLVIFAKYQPIWHHPFAKFFSDTGRKRLIRTRLFRSST